MKTRFAITLAVIGIVLYGAAAATAWAATFNDDFSSGLRPAYWSVTQTTPSLWSIDDTHGDVRLAKVGTSPGGLQNVRVELNMAAVGGPISGDFSEQIDFSNAVVGPNQDQVELHVYFQDGSYFFLVYQTGPNVHVWDGAVHGTIPVAGNSGTFTISRTGSILTAYYNGSPIYSETNTSPAMAMEFVNQLQPGSDDNTSVTFDNFSLTAASVPNACTPPPPGMVSWWPGDGNANDIQDGNNGILQGGATFAPGLVDDAFSFNVNGYVQVAYNPNLDPATGITVDAWVNPSSQQGPASMVNHRPVANNTGYTLEQQFAQDGTVLWNIFVNGSSVTVDSNTTLPLNTWTHVAGTFDGTTSRLYFDGVEVGSATASGTIDPSPGADLELGRNIVFGELFDGLIDEVEIFNRALSQTEIQAIVDAGSFGKCKTQVRATPTPRPRPTPHPRPITGSVKDNRRSR